MPVHRPLALRTATRSRLASGRGVERPRAWSLSRRAPRPQRGPRRDQGPCTPWTGVDAIDAIARVASLVARETDPDRVVAAVLDRAVATLEASAAHVLLTDDPDRPTVLRLAGQRGIPDDLLAPLREVAFDAPLLAAHAARTRTLALVPDASALDPALEQAARLLQRTGTRSMLAAPLVAGDRLYGTITCALERPRGFGRDEVAFVAAVAEVFAVGLANAASFRREREGRDALARASEEARRWLEVFRNAHFGVVLGGPSGATLDVMNDAFARMHGYTVEELTGAPIATVFAPECRATVAEHIEQAHALGHVVWESKHVRKDGTVFPVLIDASAVKDASGAVQYRVVNVQDLTDRKKAQEERERLLAAIEEERNWFRAVFAHAPIALVLVRGVEAPRLYTNPRADALLADVVQSGDPLTRAVGRLRTLEGRPVAFHDLASARALRGEVVDAEEFVIVRRDGGEVPVAITAVPIEGYDDRVTGAVVMFEDRTRRKELERLRDEWTSLVAHDLRQPAGVISVSAEMLPRLGDHQAEAQLIARVRGAARRLDRMIGDLVDFSRVEAGRLSVAPRVGDPVALIRDVLADLAATSDREHRLTVEGEIPEALLDPDRFQQVLSNLLANAAKYGARGAPIGIAVAVRDDAVEIAVTNEGPGIPSEEQPKVFDRFYRTGAARRGRAAGSGLGLYICKGIVEAQGGRIWVESAPEGPTTFRFTVPLAGRRANLGAP